MPRRQLSGEIAKGLLAGSEASLILTSTQLRHGSLSISWPKSWSRSCKTRVKLVKVRRGSLGPATITPRQCLAPLDKTDLDRCLCCPPMAPRRNKRGWRCCAAVRHQALLASLCLRRTLLVRDQARLLMVALTIRQELDKLGPHQQKRRIGVRGMHPHRRRTDGSGVPPLRPRTGDNGMRAQRERTSDHGSLLLPRSRQPQPHLALV
mmetsp:Transcript_27372/g.63170  ORF Transcript_27372/g.63170 Transcript_27372/m.63170 type:complete len:207 (+) Transcript_27372:1885-2505(+)